MRKTAATLTLITPLIVMAIVGAHSIHFSSANFFPYPGPDLPRIYIRNDGSIEPSTAPIERMGTTYKLKDNISLYTIEIQRDNIVLDGSNHLIQGNASWLGYAAGNNGVIVAGRDNVTITRLKIADYYAGVRISSSSHITVVDNSFFNDTHMGVVVQDSTLVLIEANDFTDLLTDLFVPAVNLNGSSSTIRNNRITGSAYGLNVEGSFNTVSDNVIETLLPLMLGKADSNTITGNNITGPASSYHLPGQNYRGNEGISLLGACSNNVISGNNLTGFINQAIRIGDGSNNTVYANYMANNEFAIELDQGAVNNTFYGNNFMKDSCKIRINYAQGNSWDNGTTGNYWGNYNGSDSDGDGIGDTPYTIIAYKWDNKVGGDVSFAFDKDNYPLMKPYDFEHAAVSPPAEPFVAILVAVATVVAVVLVGTELLLYHRRKQTRESL